MNISMDAQEPDVEMPGAEEATKECDITLAVDGEDHTLGNLLRDVMWSHPHVQIASYTQEHPSSNEVIVRCQTSGAISAEQGVVEALHIAKQKLNLVQSAMDDAMQRFRDGQRARSGRS